MKQNNKFLNFVINPPKNGDEDGIYIVKPKDNSYRAIWTVVGDVPLKLMSTSDGYTKEEVDKIISTIKDYQKENDKLLENIKLEISKLNSEKADRTELANVVAGLVPMGSAPNLAELETKPKRNNDAYFVEDQLSPEGDAYIYRWDDGLSKWVNTKQVVFKDVITQDLGDSSNKAMSQKAVSKEFASVRSDLSEIEYLKSEVGVGAIIQPSYTTETGYYIYSSGIKTQTEAYDLTSEIALLKGQSIIVNGVASSSVAVIAKVSDGKYTPLVIGKSTDVADTYTYQAVEDCNVVVSYRNEYSISIKKEEISNIFKNTEDIEQNKSEIEYLKSEVGGDIIIDPEYTTETGYYIYSSGTKSPTAAYDLTSEIALSKGESITVNGVASSSVAVIAKVSDGTYTPLVIGKSMDVEADTYTYQAVEDCNVVVSYRNQYSISIKKTEISNILKNRNDIDYLMSILKKGSTELYINFCRFINSIIFIGDSVTDGHVYDYPNVNTGNGKVIRELSYPSQIKKINNWATVENAGFSGYNATDWWDNKKDSYNYVDYQVAVIELGYNGQMQWTGTANEGNEIKDENATNYCNIIELIKEQNPNCFIILVVSPLIKSLGESGSKPYTYSTIIRISEYYDLPLIDLTKENFINLNDNKYHGISSGGGPGLNMVHFNAIGYFAKAVDMAYHIGEVVYNEPQKINLVGYIGL